MTDETADDSVLAAVDLHAWRVPAPPALDRTALLGRALAPQTIAPRGSRSRLGWLLVAMVLVNAAIALIIVRVTRPSPPVATVLPAGGGDSDARVHDLLARLEKEQRDLEQKLAEIRELRALVLELSKRVQSYEQAERERTVSRPTPAPVRKPLTPLKPDPLADVFDASDALPESLDRVAIADAVSAIKPKIRACADQVAASGTVKTRVQVAPDGHVASVRVDADDDRLRACVSKALTAARFPRSQRGASFAYPFLFTE